MGPEVGPAFQRLSGCTLFSSLGVRLAGTVSRHRPGNSALRVAIQTAARARSGRANDMGGIRDVRLAETSARLFDPESFVTESRSATCDVGGTPGGEGGLWKNSTTSTLALDAVRKRGAAGAAIGKNKTRGLEEMWRRRRRQGETN
eukprot:gene22577-biopygen5767